MLEKKYYVNKHLSTLIEQYLLYALSSMIVDLCLNLFIFDLGRWSKTLSFVKMTNSQESHSLNKALRSQEVYINLANLRNTVKAIVNAAKRLISLY